MAKPKKPIHMEILDKVHIIDLRCDKLVESLQELSQIEGISCLNLWSSNKQRITIYTDPRYDISEIAQEIEELLTADGPNVFRDD